jgi:hypothetical protein
MQRLIVLAFATAVILLAGGRANALVGFANAAGTISALSSSEVTVSSDHAIPGSQNSGGAVSCSLDGSSPSVAGFSVGELVAIDCEQGVLRELSTVDTKGLGKGEPLAGFPTAASLPSPGPKMTTTKCASAWNSTASATERQAILQLQPLAARVGRGITVISSIGTHTQVGGPTCLVTFILSGARTVEVKGYWKHGTVPRWHGAVWSLLLSTNWAGFAVGSDGSITHA